MTLNYSTNIVKDRLAFCVDAGNERSFDFKENLVSYSTYNPATWAIIFSGTYEEGIDAPDGSNTAVRTSATTANQSLFRISIPSFTPNGTDTYSLSFWARLVSGTTGAVSVDVDDNAPSGSYLAQLVKDEWVKIEKIGIPPAGDAQTFIDIRSNSTTDYVIDIWGLQLERSTSPGKYASTNGSAISRSTEFKNLVGNENMTLINPNFYSFDGQTKTIRFFRNMPPDPEDGGYATVTTTGELTAFEYLHNDHTTEIWIKPNDRSPTAYETNENQSVAVVFRGFHCMWYYNASNLTYTIWGRTGTTNQAYVLSINDTSENVWMQLVAVRDGNILKLYKNGELITSGTITAGRDGTPASNDLRIATANYNGSYSWHADMDFGVLRMYKKALTDSEVKKNFLSTKGRFGI